LAQERKLEEESKQGKKRGPESRALEVSKKEPLPAALQKKALVDSEGRKRDVDFFLKGEKKHSSPKEKSTGGLLEKKPRTATCATKGNG